MNQYEREQKIAASLVAADEPQTMDEAKKSLEWVLEHIKNYMEGEFFSPHSIRDNLKRAMGIVEIMERLENQVAGMKGPVKDAVEAYGDSHGLPNRKLNWKGAWVSGRELMDIAKQAVPEGYNDWTAARMARAVASLPSNWQYAFAREYSVCLYVKGFSTNEEVLKLVAVFKKARANEIGIGHTVMDAADFAAYQPKPGDEMRVWWD